MSNGQIEALKAIAALEVQIAELRKRLVNEFSRPALAEVPKYVEIDEVAKVFGMTNNAINLIKCRFPVGCVVKFSDKTYRYNLTRIIEWAENGGDLSVDTETYLPSAA